MILAGNTEGISDIIRFVLEIDKVNGILRKVKPSGADDRCMPVLLNLSNQGGSWLENGVTYERAVGPAGPEIENGCPELWTYMKAKLEGGHRKESLAATF